MINQISKNVFSPMGQVWYAVLSIVITGIQIFLSTLIFLSLGFGIKEITILSVFIFISLFLIQMLLSAKRLLDIGLNPFYTFIHLFIPIQPFMIFYLIIKRPLEQLKDKENDVSCKEDSVFEIVKSDSFPKQYYLWLLALYFILNFFPFGNYLYIYITKTPNLIELYNMIPIIFAILFILGAFLGLYLLIKSIRQEKSFSFLKVATFIFCLFVIYAQGNVIYERNFSDRAMSYKAAVIKYSIPYKVISVTNQSVFLDNGQQIFFLYLGNPTPVQFSKSNQNLIGKEINIKVPIFNKWDKNQICDKECYFFGYIYYQGDLLNTKFGFIK